MSGKPAPGSVQLRGERLVLEGEGREMCATGYTGSPTSRVPGFLQERERGQDKNAELAEQLKSVLQGTVGKHTCFLLNEMESRAK